MTPEKGLRVLHKAVSGYLDQIEEMIDSEDYGCVCHEAELATATLERLMNLAALMDFDEATDEDAVKFVGDDAELNNEN